MGGSGGSYWSNHESPSRLLGKEIEDEQRRNYKRAVNSYLQELVKDLNNRDIEQIQTHLQTVKSALERDVDGTLELRFGGSVNKHTYANGLSDVDLLVQLNGSSLHGKSPNEVLDYFVERLRERLPTTAISVGKLAVTVTFSSGHEIQLLPCVSTQSGIKIKKPESDEWSNVIRPMAFARKLTRVNQDCSGRVVPVIKLFKVLNDQLPKDIRLSGYHIESLAVEAFRNPPKQTTYYDMLHHLCQFAATAVLHPVKDATGQSVHVDDYLDRELSPERYKASKALERLSNRIKRADTMLSLEQWESLFN